jgi:uncharacterized protein (DUF2062 family)
MTLKRCLRYYWLKFQRLHDDPRKLAGGMGLGVFIGMTPTIPFHTVSALSLAALLRISPVTAFVGLQVMNPLTIVPLYYAAYKLGQILLFPSNRTLCFASICKDLVAVYNDRGMFQFILNSLHLLARGGVALQVGGLIIAIPPAVIAYFLTLWVARRYRQRQKARKAAGALRLSQSPPASSGPEA